MNNIIPLADFNDYQLTAHTYLNSHTKQHHQIPLNRHFI